MSEVYLLYKRVTLILVILVSLTGCSGTQTTKKVGIPSEKISDISPPEGASNIHIPEQKKSPVVHGNGKLAQCTQELEALKTFNGTAYIKYRNELDQLTRTSVKYLAIADSISNDINELVRPRYQYALTNLCYRIRNDLSSTLIKQVNTND